MFIQKNLTQKNTKYFSASGFSLVEIIVTAAIFTIVFGGLFGAFQLMTALIGKSKAQAGATALMTEKMEYIRSLPYNSVGTDGGVPTGAMPQNSTTTLNGITYNERVLIQYIDDAADGIGTADVNAILADYKQVKIEYTWSLRGKSDSSVLVSNIVPPGIESTAGGGTIRVNVFDASVLPVVGAEVRFVNNTTTTTIDTLRYTDLSGVVYLSAAPAAANYEITVTDAGYSTDGTYTATTSNPNPNTPPVAVLESQVSTMNFQIDKVSDLAITTVSPASYGSFFDTFADTSLIFSTSSAQVTGGDVVLTDTLGVYDFSGTVQSTSTKPLTIDSWYSLSFTASTTASTSVRVSLMYNNAGTMTLIPDSDLAGNSVGFASSPIDITSLNTTTYDEVSLQAVLTTTDTGYTSELHDWNVTYITAQVPINGVDLSIKGTKSIGTDASSQPVLKYTDTGTTDSNGLWDQNNIEWDIYTVDVTSTGYSVYEVCPASPYILNPDTSDAMKITLGSASPQLLRVTVADLGGAVIPNATVRLENTGVDQLSVTSLCGQTYFDSGLYNDSDYLLTVSASGFTTAVIASTTVSSSSTVNVILN